jgi:Bacterial Ig domain
MRARRRPAGASSSLGLIRAWVLVLMLAAAGPLPAAAQPSTANLYPQNLEAGVSPTPTLEIACTTTGLTAARYQIGTDPGFLFPLAYDSGVTINDLCSHVAAVNLAGLTTYHWRAAVRDTLGTWSDWSVPTSFTTANATLLHTNMFQNGTLAYSGTHDADIRGLFANPAGPPAREWNQGRQDVLRMGRAPVGATDDELYRALLKFDLSLNLTNPDAVVNVYLELTGWQHSDPFVFSTPVSLYEVRREWNEGRGLVSPILELGDVSWTYSAYPDTWTVRGAGAASDTDPAADRAATPLVKLVPTNQVGHVTRWSSRAFVELVKRWIAQPDLNYGVLLRADDESLRDVLNLASREHNDPSFRPLLVIESTERAVWPPAANDDFAATVTGTAVDIAVLGNDIDPEPGPGPLVIQAIGTPAHGSAQVLGTSIRYTPAAGFVGIDAFSYTISDGALTGTGTVNVSVSPSAGVQLWLEAETGVLTAPMVIADDTKAASWGQYVTVPNGMGNVDDPTLPGGQASYTFSVPAGTYVIWGRVLAPTGNDDSFWVSMDAQPFTRWNTQMSSTWVWDQINNATVADPLLFALTAGTHTLVIKQREDGARLDRLLITSNRTFVPQGLGGGATNQPPVANNDSATTSSGTAINIAVLVNDSDPDNGPSPLAIVSRSTPGHGTASISGTVIRYTPAAGFSGTDTFTYTVSDGAATATATVTVTVSPPASAVFLWIEAESGTLISPMAPAADSAASGGLYITTPDLGDGIDATQPGGQATYSFTVPTTATYVIWGRVLSVNGNNDSFWVSMDAQPFTRWNTQISSTWVWDQINNATVADPLLFSLTAGAHTLVIKQREDGARLDRLLVTSDRTFVPQGLGEGSATNQPPVANNDSATTSSGTAVDIAVLANDSDPDNGPSPLAIVSRSTPGHGTASISGTVIRYTPAAGFSGTDTFTYTVSDGAATATATVTVTVSPPASAVFLWIEAESGTLVSPMATAADSAASGGLYITTPDLGDGIDATQPGGQATYSFTVPTTATYVIWGRVLSVNGNNDSFWVSMDAQPFTRWNTQISSTWVWDQINNATVADPLLFSLTAGAHTLVIKQREDGARLDRLLITSDRAFRP